MHFKKSRSGFRRLIEQAMVTGPVTEADVTFGYDWDGKARLSMEASGKTD
jgi:hypothetical protein